MTRKRSLWLVFIGASMFSNFALLSNVWTQVSKKAQIAFESDRDGNFEIYVMDINGRNPRNLTLHPSGDSSSAWSPGGRQITFVSNRTGNAEIHIMDADGQNVRKITNYLDFDHAPTWSSDGRQIAFVSVRGEQ